MLIGLPMARPDDSKRGLRSHLAVAFAAAGLVLLPTAATAQAYAQPVVQPLPDPATVRLNDALRRLAQDPRSVQALVDAAQASVALDDVDAADGFIRRAEAIMPGDGRVLAGRASVLVRRQQPVEALRLFAAAEQAGEQMRLHSAERGLAFDLIGDNIHAQQEYQQFLTLADDPLVTRRLALSQAIAGDQRASEATLLPLLQRTDLAAYRTRAFALAILGKTEEAVSIAETMLPERLASRMAPYLRYMPRLTRAQQAAAGNLGVFPQAAQIGRDDPALAAYIPPAPGQPVQATADSRLVPSGPPLGNPPAREGGIPRRAEIAQPVAQPTPSPAPAPVQVAAVTPPPASNPAQVAAVPVWPPVSQPSPDRVYAQPPATQVAVLQPAQQAPAPEISLPPSEAPAAELPPEPEIDLAQAFADFSLPAAAARVADGAVDITTITPRVEAPPAPAPRPAPAKPVIPSRQWVQVATGRDTGALAFDWRRIKREAGGLLDRPAPHIAKWGQTNRLVVGPFANAREADALVARLKDKKIDSFRFTSDQGEEVKPLS